MKLSLTRFPRNLFLLDDMSEMDICSSKSMTPSELMNHLREKGTYKNDGTSIGFLHFGVAAYLEDLWGNQWEKGVCKYHKDDECSSIDDKTYSNT